MPGSSLVARAATEQDAELLLAWRNDPETRRWSRTTAPVEPAEHRTWLRGVLAAPSSRLLLIVQENGLPVGVVRFDRGQPEGVWEVSITVAPEHRGRGLATRCLALGEATLTARIPNAHTLCAHIHTQNTRSRALFQRAGYTPTPHPNSACWQFWTRVLAVSDT